MHSNTSIPMHEFMHAPMEDRMKTLAILSRKGGTGKTTLAVHLSVAASLAGHTTVLIDLDPQASACKWSDIRQADAPDVISAHEYSLPEILHKADNIGVDLVILDTPPKSDCLETAGVSDYALIPCRPAIFDLQAIESTIKIAEIAGIPSSVVMNFVIPQSTMLIEARRAVKGYNTNCAPVTLGQRVAFSHALIDGKAVQEFSPNSKASSEINALYKYIAKQMEI